jgi:wobble nucleotide-excising tRNase
LAKLTLLQIKSPNFVKSGYNLYRVKDNNMNKEKSDLRERIDSLKEKEFKELYKAKVKSKKRMHESETAEDLVTWSSIFLDLYLAISEKRKEQMDGK